MSETKEPLLSRDVDERHRDEEASLPPEYEVLRATAQRDRLLYAIILLAFTALIVDIYLSLTSYNTKLSHGANGAHGSFDTTDCGNSTQEAIANGCVMDFISGAWVHTECYDEELEIEFLSLSDWHWYADENGLQELSMESIRQNGGPNPIWVSQDYHRQHCAYTWRKLHRAVIRGNAIDSHIGEFHHTVHCANRVTRRNDTGLAWFSHIYTECRLPQDFNG